MCCQVISDVSCVYFPAVRCDVQISVRTMNTACNYVFPDSQKVLGGKQLMKQKSSDGIGERCTKNVDL